MPSIVWKGHLTFGLVSIPVKLFRAARRERLSLHYVHRPEPAAPPAMAPMSGRGAEPAKSETRSPRFEPAPAAAEPKTATSQLRLHASDRLWSLQAMSNQLPERTFPRL